MPKETKPELKEKESRNLKKEEPNFALIMRGLPGSGKSTFVSFLSSLVASSVHAVDDLHTGNDGSFYWDESLSESRYYLNYSNFIQSCHRGDKLVICDCINLDRSSVDKYVSAAKSFGYFVYVVTPDQPSVLESSIRNLHDVSADQAKSMLSSWEDWPDKSLF